MQARYPGWTLGVEAVHDVPVSEPIPIPIRDMGPQAGEPESEPAADDEVLLSEAVAQVLVELVTVGTSVVADIAAERGVPMEGSSERLLRAGAGLTVEAIRTMGVWFAAIERAATDLAANSTAGRTVADHGLAAWARTRDDEHAAGETSLDPLVDAVLERIDLTELIRRHLDIDAVVEDLDTDALMDRIDMQRLTDRIDIDALVQRLDIAAVIDRLDMPELVASVMQELDLPELIRETAGDTASDEVRQLRLRSVDADRLVQRAVDRVLGRNRES
jgi:hypothetical protein